MPRRDATLIGATPPPGATPGERLGDAAITDLYRSTSELSRNALLPDSLDVQAITTTTAYTLDADAVLLVDTATGGANVAVTLPLAAATPGRIYLVKHTTTDANNIVLTAAGADTIDGAATLTYGAGARLSRLVVSDGVSAWHVIGAF